MGEAEGTVRLKTDGRIHTVYEIAENLVELRLFRDGTGRHYFFGKVLYGACEVYVGECGEDVLRKVEFTKNSVMLGMHSQAFFEHNGEECSLFVPSMYDYGKRNRQYQSRRPQIVIGNEQMDLESLVFGFVYKGGSSSPVKLRRSYSLGKG